MSITSILVIGGGNMGAALAARWKAWFPKARLVIAEADPKRRALLRRQGFDAPRVVPKQDFEIVVLAIKPQTFAALGQDEITRFTKKAVLVSIMAGVPLAKFKKLAAHVARVMPNTPAMIGEGISAIYAPNLSKKQLEAVKELFGATGHVVILNKERQMHAVTAISGSGPAYVFAFMEALEAAAKKAGLDAATARALTVQTVRGAALLADQKGGDAATLRKQVTSPGGTTEAALKALSKGRLMTLIGRAVKAAKARSEALSG